MNLPWFGSLAIKKQEQEIFFKERPPNTWSIVSPCSVISGYRTNRFKNQLTLLLLGFLHETERSLENQNNDLKHSKALEGAGTADSGSNGDSAMSAATTSHVTQLQHNNIDCRCHTCNKPVQVWFSSENACQLELCSHSAGTKKRDRHSCIFRKRCK